MTGPFEGLLDPIPGPEPCGPSLRWGPVHAAIEAAREEDDPDLPQGVWERELRRADWPEAIRLCRDALARKSKDLQVACWLVEAVARRDGAPAAGPGLRFLAALCEAFWDGLHPAHDGESDSPRYAPLVWLDGALAQRVATLPLVARETDAGPVRFSWSDYETARRGEVERRKAKPSKRKGPAPATVADFDEAAAATPTAALAGLRDGLNGLLAAAATLDGALAALGGEQAPSMTRARGAIEAALALLGPILSGRPPDPSPDSLPEPSPAPPEPLAMAADPARPDPARPDPDEALGAELAKMTAAIRPSPAVIETREQAYRALADIAAVLRRLEPHSPTPYLIERAARWGGMSLAEVLADLSKDGRDPQMLGWLLGESGSKK